MTRPEKRKIRHWPENIITSDMLPSVSLPSGQQIGKNDVMIQACSRGGHCSTLIHPSRVFYVVLLFVFIVLSSSASSQVTRQEKIIETAVATYRWVEVYSERQRDYIRKNYEKSINRSSKERALRNITAFDQAIALIPLDERELVREHAAVIKWIEVDAVEAEGQRITAISFFAPRDIYAISGHAKELGDVAKKISNLKSLRAIFFDAAGKSGVDFEQLGLLSELKEFEPPIDVTDEDLSAMQNLGRLEAIHLNYRKGINGSFLNLIRNSKLRYLEAHGAGIEMKYGNVLLELPHIESIWFPAFDRTLSLEEAKQLNEMGRLEDGFVDSE